ncbi:hypothetical protein DTO207G8_3758 [Paecilomyces variotii]|nr:hypothetical protein DTO032I3_6457 [Paecilomyces variotii]KAJ9254181.1 hypothetical protein DTO207G8_3758 [Paecilomyces variotii]KAJ9276492.1 hypothetical protein DTO021D3_6698 [Paecilomyces variotii]KAJ9286408.1 hypothetical protein DTO021C3_5942 [Paecilomyces variotii]KAJ9338750.1 hypothetical protein DTO027B6_8690 [Paecilomyces variotii]
MIRFCCEFTLFGGFRVTKVWQPPAARVELVRISGKLPTSVHEPASPQPHRTKTGISRQNRVAASGQPHQIPYFLRIIPPPAEFFFASWSVVAVSHLALQAVHHLSLQPVAVTELADPALSDVATSTPLPLPIVLLLQPFPRPVRRVEPSAESPNQFVSRSNRLFFTLLRRLFLSPSAHATACY